MGKELEPQTVRTPVRTSDDDEYAGGGYANIPTVVNERPSWADPVPPETAAFGRKIQLYWSWIIRPFRYMAIGFLMITDYWYKFAIFVCVITSLIIVFITR